MKKNILNTNKKLQLGKVVIARLNAGQLNKILGGNNNNKEEEDNASTTPRCNPTQRPTQKTQ